MADRGVGANAASTASTATTRSGTPTLLWSAVSAGVVVAIFLGANAPTPLYRLWQQQWDFGQTVSTQIYSAYMVGLVLALTIAGRFADRYGRRRVLIPGVIIAALSAVTYLTATGVASLIAGRFLSGVAVGAAITAGVAAVVDVAPPHRRAVASLLGSAAMVLGAGLGPLLAGGIASATGSPMMPTFVVVIVAVAIAGVLVFRLPLAAPERGGPRASGALWSWPRVPRVNRRQLLWGVVTFAPGLCCTAFFLSLGTSTLAVVTGQNQPLLAGAVACAMFLVATGVQFALARLPRKRQLLASSMATVLCAASLMAFTHIDGSALVFVVSALLAGAGQGLGQLAGITLIAEHVVEERRAEANASLSIAGYVLAGGLILITGSLADLLGLIGGVTLFAAAVTTMAVCGIAVVLRTFTR